MITHIEYLKKLSAKKREKVLAQGKELIAEERNWRIPNTNIDQSLHAVVVNSPNSG